MSAALQRNSECDRRKVVGVIAVDAARRHHRGAWWEGPRITLVDVFLCSCSENDLITAQGGRGKVLKIGMYGDQRVLVLSYIEDSLSSLPRF